MNSRAILHSQTPALVAAALLVLLALLLSVAG